MFYSVGLEANKRTLSGSSLEIHGSTSPVSGMPRPPCSRQRIVKPVGSSTLSFSLDKGLDEINLQKSEKSMCTELSRQHNIAHLGSEPLLAPGIEKSIDSSEELGQERFQQIWQDKSSTPVSADEDPKHKQFIESNFSARKKEKKEEIENLASLIDKMNLKTRVNSSYNSDGVGMTSNNENGKRSANMNGEETILESVETRTDNLVFQRGFIRVRSRQNSEVAE